jgi:hypothetical protein
VVRCSNAFRGKLVSHNLLIQTKGEKRMNRPETTASSPFTEDSSVNPLARTMDEITMSPGGTPQPHRHPGPAQSAAIHAAGAVPVRTSTTRHRPGKLRRTPAGIYIYMLRLDSSALGDKLISLLHRFGKA